jgi:polyisoprenyl-phosphate glycosyltransferase
LQDPELAFFEVFLTMQKILLPQANAIDFAPVNQPAATNSLGTNINAVEVSVVIPVYKSAQSLFELHSRLDAVLSAMNAKSEIIFVDDGSPDNSFEIAVGLVKKYAAIRVLRLSRNFGQHAAITAGIASAQGNWIVVMDCDLQEPPEHIQALYRQALQGSDIVLARRIRRKDSFWRSAMAKAYFRLLNMFAQSKLDGEYGTFSIISRPVAEAYLRFTDHNRHYLLILFWLGFKRSSIEFEHQARTNGKSSYTLARLIRHALQGAFFQSTVLLECIIFAGFVLSCLGGLGAIVAIVAYFTHGALAGWTSLSVMILVLSGVNLSALGIIGLYVGQIFEQSKARPLFVVSDEINIINSSFEHYTEAQPAR